MIMAKLLIVDDEPHILSALRRCLSGRDEFQDVALEYQIVLHSATAAALQEAEETGFDLVLCDYRMPMMDGVTFIKELRYLQPDITAIILSGMADLQGVVRAINEAGIHRFIPKPWDDYELRATVAGALAFRQLQIENQRLADELRLQRSRVHCQQMELLRLEKETPGITKVKFADDGSISLDEGLL